MTTWNNKLWNISEEELGVIQVASAEASRNKVVSDVSVTVETVEEQSPRVSEGSSKGSIVTNETIASQVYGTSDQYARKFLFSDRIQHNIYVQPLLVLVS